MDVSSALTLLKEWGPVFGPALLVLVFFLWKDWRRENRLQDRVEALEKEQKEVLLPMIERCATVIAQNTAVMIRLEKVIDRLAVLAGQEERCILDQLIEDAAEHRKESV
jgi:hypothetical protein